MDQDYLVSPRPAPHFQPSDRRSIRLRRTRLSFGSRLGDAQMRTLSPMWIVVLSMPSRSSRDVLAHSAA